MNPSAKVRQLEIPIMPTTKPKNKKAVAVKSGGRVSVKQGKAKEKPQKQEAVYTLDELGDAGITALVQPGGSVNDEKVIAAANRRNMAMVFTGVRHFKH